MVTWGTPLGCCRALMTRAPKGYPSRRFPRHELPLGEAVGPTFLGVWEVRFASGTFGMLSVAPMLIGIAALTHDPPRWRQLAEGTLALVLLAVMNGLALTVFVGPWSMIAPTAALFPLLLWLSVRYPPAFAAAGVFI